MTDKPTPQNVAETVRDIMAAARAATPLAIDTGEYDYSETMGRTFFASVPDGHNVEDYTAEIRRAAQFFVPARRTGTATLTALDSLILWTNRFKGPQSAIFASEGDFASGKCPRLLSVINYHGACPPAQPGEWQGGAEHGDHRAIYDFPLSREWKDWMTAADKPMEKDQFGEFIERNALSIMDPTPAILQGKPEAAAAPWETRLIDIARQINGRYGQLRQFLDLSIRFQAFEKSDLQVTTNRDTGEAQVQFINEHKGADGQPLKLPNLIIIAIPVFRNGDLFRMPVRFRYRKTGADVRFILSPYNPERAMDIAFTEALDKVRDETGLPVIMGTPEQ